MKPQSIMLKVEFEFRVRFSEFWFQGWGSRVWIAGAWRTWLRACGRVCSVWGKLAGRGFRFHAGRINGA